MSDPASRMMCLIGQLLRGRLFIHKDDDGNMYAFVALTYHGIVNIADCRTMDDKGVAVVPELVDKLRANGTLARFHGEFVEPSKLRIG